MQESSQLQSKNRTPLQLHSLLGHVEAKTPVKSIIEKGDCYALKTKEDIECWEILELIGDTLCLQEHIWARKEKRADGESYSYHDRPSFERWDVGISIDMRERKGFTTSYEVINKSDYDANRITVLSLLNLKVPENPLFKNIIAAQNAVEAERLIKMAVELEKYGK